MIRIAPMGVCLIAAALCASSELQAQAGKREAGVTSTSTRTRGRGADPNVRLDDAPNDINRPSAPEPPGKSTRGPTPLGPGQICIDSRVDLRVKIYVDGNFGGVVSSFGDSCGFYGPGDHRLYARAMFTDGSQSSWGPVTADATVGFRWTVRP